MACGERTRFVGTSSLSQSCCSLPPLPSLLSERLSATNTPVISVKLSNQVSWAPTGRMPPTQLAGSTRSSACTQSGWCGQHQAAACSEQHRRGANLYWVLGMQMQPPVAGRSHVDFVTNPESLDFAVHSHEAF